MPLHKIEAAYSESTSKPLHIGWYPSIRCIRDIITYLQKTGLAGGGHQATGAQQMHVTLLYTHGRVLSPSYPKVTPLEQERATLPKGKYPVGPLSIQNMAQRGNAIAILFAPENAKAIKSRSDKLHEKFKIKPNMSNYIYHMTISKIQLNGAFKNIQSYYKLPLYTGILEFTDEIVSYQDN